MSEIKSKVISFLSRYVGKQKEAPATDLRAVVSKIVYTDEKTGAPYYEVNLVDSSGKVVKTEIRPFMAE